MRYTVISFIVLLCWVFDTHAQQYRISTDHPAVTFEKENPLFLSIYSWPETLISYPVTFSPDSNVENRLELIDTRTGNPVAFQLSDKKYDNNRICSARIHFFASMSAGGGFKYTLRLGSRKMKSDHPVYIERKTDCWILGNTDFSVAIPVTATVNDNIAPAPILSVSKGEGASGRNRLYSGHKKIVSVETSVKESGELFAECLVLYRLEGGAEYRTSVKVVQGYPFVIFDEEMSGIEKQDGVFVDMEWTGFHPTHKYANWDRQKDVTVADGVPVEQPLYTNYCQEDPHWTGEGWIEQVDKEMVYRLLPFGGNSTREQVPVMTFWESGKDARELGVFVYDHNRWNDRQYGIWQPTPDLSVYFRYADEKLYFKYPVQNGTRSTAIAFTRIGDTHPKVEAFNKSIDDIAANGGKDHSAEMVFRYTMMLHRQYALLNLDKVKNWVLEYPREAKRPENPFIKRPKETSADRFYKQIVTSPMVYYMTGMNSFPGIHSISHRPVYSQWVQDYLTYYKDLSDEQRKTVEALFLLAGYVNILEPMNAIRTSLAGTANMAADGWAVTGQTAFLFPEHPMAKEWADFFEKSIEVYGLFYTRPEVSSYESKGGRWVESLGVYNWAYLRPTVHSNIALELFDGKNRFADSHMAQRARWMVDMVTPGRAYPPHGAHGGGRLVPRYAPVYELGNWLQYYDPLVAENLRWLGAIGEDVEEKANDTKWVEVHKNTHQTKDTGTNPHLKSCKYTGHGIVLRAGVDSDEELSIHLNQVDKGPNYRWGHQGQGNAGGIYFYAQDKVYTGHENEAVGDHTQNNTDGVTNFGVMKNGTFCNIGMNELVAPLYDLEIAQMAEVRSAEGKDSFAWPEYVSRSILLVGTDYFLIYDQTGTNWRAFNRFSWFTRKEDELPKIVFMDKVRPEYWTTAGTAKSKGFYRDGVGSLLTLVTHKKESVHVLDGKLTVPALLKGNDVYEFVPDKSRSPKGVVHVATDKSRDIIFRDSEPITWHSDSVTFKGEAGMVRRMKNGDLQLALFKGSEIAADGLGIHLTGETETAIALTRLVGGDCKGRLKSDGKATLTLTGVKGGKLYIDGVMYKGNIAGVKLPAGEHAIEYTAKEPVPMPTTIEDVVYAKAGNMVYLSKPQSVSKVRMELSKDGGKSWEVSGTTTKTIYMLPKLAEGKYHVRAVSVNGKKEAASACEYPVYISKSPSHYPEGLKLQLDSGRIDLSWGQVLGTEVYRVYRRKLGDKEFLKVYEGKATSFADEELQGVVPAFSLPGSLDNADADRSGIIVYEYTVTALNGNGESAMAPVVNSDPASWANWYPSTELKFKRRSAFWMEPYVPANAVPGKYYPD